MVCRILVSIDDTDNLESPGTGELADEIAAFIVRQGWGHCQPVTRHQLLIHPDIPYTSHNSAMCFEASIDAGWYEALIRWASDYLEHASAPGSDPGLCVLQIDQLRETQPLIAFGERAKVEVLQKRDAYDLARRYDIHLSEHGGTGGGIIGALAGAGLRLAGRDGRVRGHLQGVQAGQQVTVQNLMSLAGVAEVRAYGGQTLPPDALIRIGDKAKSVLLDGRFVLLVQPDEAHEEATLHVAETSGVSADERLLAPLSARWRTCTKQELKNY